MFVIHKSYKRSVKRTLNVAIWSFVSVNTLCKTHLGRVDSSRNDEFDFTMDKAAYGESNSVKAR